MYFKLPVSFHCSWRKIQNSSSWLTRPYMIWLLLTYLLSPAPLFLDRYSPCGPPLCFKHALLFLTLYLCLWGSFCLECRSVALAMTGSSSILNSDTHECPKVVFTRYSLSQRPSQPLSHSVMILFIYLLPFWLPILLTFKLHESIFIFCCILFCLSLHILKNKYIFLIF